MYVFPLFFKTFWPIFCSFWTCLTIFNLFSCWSNYQKYSNYMWITIFYFLYLHFQIIFFLFIFLFVSIFVYVYSIHILLYVILALRNGCVWFPFSSSPYDVLFKTIWTFIPFNTFWKVWFPVSMFRTSMLIVYQGVKLSLFTVLPTKWH